MPAIKQLVSPVQARTDPADTSHKKLKTDELKGLKNVCPQYQLKWCVKNRVDYFPPLLRQPYGVKVTNDYILIAEGLWPHSRLNVLDAGGHSQRIIGKGEILPYGITSTVTGDIALTDHKDRTVKFYSLSGDLLNSWETNKFDWPNGIATTKEGYFVIGDWSKGKIYIMNAQGDEIHSFSTALKEGILSCPDYLVVDSQGRIILSDTYDNSIKVFSIAGEYIMEIGKDLGPGYIEQPKGIAVDDKDNIIVADWADDTVKMYDSSGSWVADLVTKRDSLRHPLAIDVDTSRNGIVVTEHILKGEPSLKMFASA